MTYKVGNLVILIIKNLKQKRLSKKLSYKFIEFFRIKNKVGAQAYRLRLSTFYWIHYTFYISLLEPYHYRECGDTSDIFI